MLVPRLRALAAAALLLTASAAHAQSDNAGHTDPMDHMMHGDVGTVQFANSCAPAVQTELQRGVAMLHSFWFGAGEQAFRDVLAKDPGCAIADWGIASILMRNPLSGAGPNARAAERAQQAIAQARASGAGTQRERDYIEAAATYYQDWSAHPERDRQAARSAAYDALAAKYPDDDEAQIFDALYILAIQLPTDRTYAAYARGAAILDRQLARHPDHPGIAHYLIHAYDAPPLAAQGLTAARRYAELAPAAPHAQHMPSHIFTRVGAWAESATSNQRAFDAALKTGELPEAWHASDYAVYADLQLARDSAAHDAMEACFKVVLPPPVPVGASYAMAAMPARYALERGDWHAAMLLVPAKGGTPYSEALTWFARALGAARTGDLEAAQQAEAELAALHQALLDDRNKYWANEVLVQQTAASAWIALLQQRPDEALKLMRDAADREDGSEKHIVTPGRLVPARELLGDMLLQAGQPAIALVEFKTSQQREPNRFRGYAGAARAADAAGDPAQAADFYRKLLDLAKGGDGNRPELAQARAYLAR